MTLPDGEEVNEIRLALAIFEAAVLTLVVVYGFSASGNGALSMAHRQAQFLSAIVSIISG